MTGLLLEGEIMRVEVDNPLGATHPKLAFGVTFEYWPSFFKGAAILAAIWALFFFWPKADPCCKGGKDCCTQVQQNPTPPAQPSLTAEQQADASERGTRRALDARDSAELAARKAAEEAAKK